MLPKPACFQLLSLPVIWYSPQNYDELSYVALLRQSVLNESGSQIISEQPQQCACFQL